MDRAVQEEMAADSELPPKVEGVDREAFQPQTVVAVVLTSALDGLRVLTVS
jgi:hypothetical protein